MEGKDPSSFFTSLLSSLRPHVLAVSIACIGLVLIGYGMITSFMPTAKSSDISFETEGSPVKKTSAHEAKNGKLVVDVSGAVKKPGVYRIEENGRIQDAVMAAGGFSDDADFDWTQHSLNLAAKVTDGMKIYVPRVGESSTGTTSTTSNTGGVVAGASTTGLVSINSASISELEDLPGIGPVTAGKIIDNRPYGSINEMLSKKAVGKSTYEKIKELVSL